MEWNLLDKITERTTTAGNLCSSIKSILIRAMKSSQKQEMNCTENNTHNVCRPILTHGQSKRKTAKKRRSN